MRIYVGTYAKYNSGSIQGAWLDLDDYTNADEFYAACKEIHKDEEDPELMFQDWEEIPESMISESHLNPEVFTLAEAYDEYGQERVNAYLYLFDTWDSEGFEETYRGEYESWEALAEDLLAESGDLELIPEHLRYYFDYEKYARDLRIGGDFVEHDGYYFWGNR